MALFSADDITYPPLDVPKPVADGVWIVDSGPLRVFGLLGLPIRMTALQLSSGDMLLHSPTRFDARLKAEIEAHGPIRHLVAPNIAHWSFLAEWQRQCPDAVTWAAPGLRERANVKASGASTVTCRPRARPSGRRTSSRPSFRERQGSGR